LKEGSELFWGKNYMASAIGGSIPFVNIFDQIFPNTNFFVTGALGPDGNAHAPNEFLILEKTKNLISSLSYIIAGL
jgi:acetylornithine deacetylase/succinyl-diaminopimelate desuccinylase-like protein